MSTIPTSSSPSSSASKSPAKDTQPITRAQATQRIAAVDKTLAELWVKLRDARDSTEKRAAMREIDANLDERLRLMACR